MEFAEEQKKARQGLFLVSSLGKVAIEVEPTVDHRTIVFGCGHQCQGLAAEEKIFWIFGVDRNGCRVKLGRRPGFLLLICNRIREGESGHKTAT